MEHMGLFMDMYLMLFVGHMVITLDTILMDTVLDMMIMVIIPALVSLQFLATILITMFPMAFHVITLDTKAMCIIFIDAMIIVNRYFGIFNIRDSINIYICK